MSLHDAREDLRGLLNKEYDKKSALDFVCNHYGMDKDQRNILARTTFSDKICDETRKKEVEMRSLKGSLLLIDTYNVLITLESVLYDDPLICDDGIVRDGKGVFGKYRMDDRTVQTIEKIRGYLSRALPSKVVFYIDSKVSRSGELALIIREMRWPMDIETKVIDSVDHELRNSKEIVATADYGIIKYLDSFVDIPKSFLFSW